MACKVATFSLNCVITSICNCTGYVQLNKISSCRESKFQIRSILLPHWFLLEFEFLLTNAKSGFYPLVILETEAAAHQLSASLFPSLPLLSRRDSWEIADGNGRRVPVEWSLLMTTYTGGFDIIGVLEEAR